MHNKKDLVCPEAFVALPVKLDALGVKEPAALYLLLLGIQVIRQSRTKNIAYSRFQTFTGLLPQLVNQQAATAIAAYMSEFWLSEKWVVTWVDCGR